MIAIKSGRDLKAMREACVISARALKLAGEAVEPGVTTGEIDRRIRKYIESTGAKPSFLGYGGFPASACISVNNEVIHGIPGKRVIHAGDVVSVDVGAFFNGYHGDNAATFPCGDISPEAKALLDATRESLYEGIRAAMAGNRIGDIGAAVQLSLIHISPPACACIFTARSPAWLSARAARRSRSCASNVRKCWASPRP